MGTEPVTTSSRRTVTEMSTPVSPPPARSPEGGSRPAGLTGRLHLALDAIRAKPTGRVALKVTIGVFGGLIVALGIALIPLPGPGWAIVILGLAIWAIERPAELAYRIGFNPLIGLVKDGNPVALAPSPASPPGAP